MLIGGPKKGFPHQVPMLYQSISTKGSESKVGGDLTWKSVKPR